jgi:hypothetical protein
MDSFCHGDVSSPGGPKLPKVRTKRFVHVHIENNAQIKAFIENSSASSFKFISLLPAYFKEDATFLVKSFLIGTTTVEIFESYIAAVYHIQKGKKVNTQLVFVKLICNF